MSIGFAANDVTTLEDRDFILHLTIKDDLGLVLLVVVVGVIHAILARFLLRRSIFVLAAAVRLALLAGTIRRIARLILGSSSFLLSGTGLDTIVDASRLSFFEELVSAIESIASDSFLGTVLAHEALI